MSTQVFILSAYGLEKLTYPHSIENLFERSVKNSNLRLTNVRRAVIIAAGVKALELNASDF